MGGGEGAAALVRVRVRVGGKILVRVWIEVRIRARVRVRHMLELFGYWLRLDVPPSNNKIPLCVCKARLPHNWKWEGIPQTLQQNAMGTGNMCTEQPKKGSYYFQKFLLFF